MESELRHVQPIENQDGQEAVSGRQPGLPPRDSPAPRMSLEDLGTGPGTQQTPLPLEARDGMSQRRGAFGRMRLSMVDENGFQLQHSSNQDALKCEGSKPVYQGPMRQQQLASNTTAAAGPGNCKVPSAGGIRLQADLHQELSEHVHPAATGAADALVKTILHEDSAMALRPSSMVQLMQAATMIQNLNARAMSDSTSAQARGPNWIWWMQ